jgi:hypothetical protein
MSCSSISSSYQSDLHSLCHQQLEWNTYDSIVDVFVIVPAVFVIVPPMAPPVTVEVCVIVRFAVEVTFAVVLYVVVTGEMWRTDEQ